MTHNEVIKNRINYYISRIIELQNRKDIHDYSKAIKDYKLMIIKELEGLKKEV